MFLNSNIEAMSDVGEVHVDRPALARHQLSVSLGAFVLLSGIALSVIGAQTGMNNSLTARLNSSSPIIATTAREVPSNPMQAIQRSTDDRRS